MNRHWGSIDCKSQHEFRLRFQRALTDYLFRGGSLAEGFGIVWERTMEQVPLDDDAQGQMYRQLLAWAKSDDLFTGTFRAAALQRPTRDEAGPERYSTAELALRPARTAP